MRGGGTDRAMSGRAGGMALAGVLCAAVSSPAGAQAVGDPGARPRVVQVVLPAAPTPIERFAAEELGRCLQLSLGWQVQVREGAPRGDARPVFWVGTAEAERLAPVPAAWARGKADALREDGVALRGDGRNVILLGKGPRGALNAVYTFLERYVGCRWPEPDREYVPRQRALKLDGIAFVSNPAFPYRGIAIHGQCSPEWFTRIVDWLGKNRLNGFQLFIGHYETLRPQVLAEVQKRGLSPNIGAHSREFFFPAEKYFQEHPEYFALVKGERTPHTQLCYANLDSVPQYVENIVTYLQTRPEITMVGLWPSDGYGFCECERCQAGHVTDVILNYTNALARGVAEKLPQMKCEFLSYIHYTVPPKEVRPLPQLVPTYCEYWSRSQFHPITEERNENRRCREELAQWIALAKEVTLFSYYGDDCIKRFLYNPLEDVVVTDLRTYHKMGLAGHFVLLTNPESWWSQAPHLYAYARAAWDPAITPRQVAEEYYASLYGPAAEAMQAHAAACRALFDLKLVQGATGEEVLFGFGFPHYDVAKDEESRAQVAAAIERILAPLAEARAANAEAWVQQRVAKLEADAHYLQTVFDIARLVRLAQADPTPEAKQQVVDAVGQALTLDVMGDDYRGYRSARNTLLAIAREVGGAEPPLARGSDKERAEYERRGVWRWTTADIVPSSKEKPRRIVIEVTERVKGAGTYEVVWDYLDGADGLSTLSTGLYSSTAAEETPAELTPLALDEHEGFTGGGDTRSVYTLTLKEYDPQRRYFLVGLVYNMREFDTFGQVLFSLKE